MCDRPCSGIPHPSDATKGAAEGGGRETWTFRSGRAPWRLDERAQCRARYRERPGARCLLAVWVPRLPAPIKAASPSTHLMKDCDYADRLWLCGRAVLQVDVPSWVIGGPAKAHGHVFTGSSGSHHSQSYVLLQTISCYAVP